MALKDITADHVYEALSDIDRDGINNYHRGLIANGYELWENNKVYSPKYVISIAHTYVDGQELNSKSFNSTEARKHLTQLGFTINRAEKQPFPANDLTFTWVPLYLEMCPKLLEYSPKELLDLIKQVLRVQNLAGLNDRLTKGDPNNSELDDIDPYTFLSFLNKTGDTKRLAVLSLLKEEMGLESPTPTDVHGIPTSQAQSVWMFAYAYDRKPDDIEQLKTLYRQINDNTVTSDQFERVLKIKMVGKAKLTEALFCQKPNKYLPINKQTKPWLEKRGLPSYYNTLSEYQQILRTVQEADSRPFYEISWEAYQENNPLNQTDGMKYYCVGVTSKGDDVGSQLSRFIEESIWENGKDKYIGIVKNVPVGAILAAKTNNRHTGTLDIKAIGEVTGNEDDGRILLVDWIRTEFSVPGKGAAYSSTIREVTKQDDIDLIFFHQNLQPVKVITVIDSRYSQNIILYGPPGTGKTYETIDLSVDIIDGDKNQDHKINKARFDKLRQDGQIDFVTFHQSYTYEDFVIGLKPDVTAGSLLFKQREGIFYKMAKRARQNFENQQNVEKNSPQPMRNFNEVFIEFSAELDKGPIVMKMARGGSFKITAFDKERQQLIITIPTGSIHELSVYTIKKTYGKNYHLGNLQPYYRPVIEKINDLGRKQITEVQKNDSLLNYVLIIDEINRANMSRVFGELITLLERDKRLGAENELTVTLPSGELFAVPPNLYLIGTMNTADKSLALLDIALRRRFEFMVKNPNYEILSDHSRKLLERLNRVIITHKKSADYQIGHAYFMGVTADQINTVLNNRVIPLLMEYFNGRTDLVEKILSEATIPVKRDELTYQLTAQDE